MFSEYLRRHPHEVGESSLIFFIELCGQIIVLTLVHYTLSDPNGFGLPLPPLKNFSSEKHYLRSKSIISLNSCRNITILNPCCSESERSMNLTCPVTPRNGGSRVDVINQVNHQGQSGKCRCETIFNLLHCKPNSGCGITIVEIVWLSHRYFASMQTSMEIQSRDPP